MVAVDAQAEGLLCVVSENVPKAIEVGVMPTLFLPTGSADLWAERILEFADKKSMDKETINRKIAEAGYDIIDSVKRIEKLYLS